MILVRLCNDIDTRTQYRVKITKTSDGFSYEVLKDVYKFYDGLKFYEIELGPNAFVYGRFAWREDAEYFISVAKEYPKMIEDYCSRFKERGARISYYNNLKEANDNMMYFVTRSLNPKPNIKYRINRAMIVREGFKFVLEEPVGLGEILFKSKDKNKCKSFIINNIEGGVRNE